MLEHFYEIHGVGLRFLTESPAMAEAGRHFLRHFQRESLDQPASVEIRFHAVRHRAEIPIALSPTAQPLFSGKPSGAWWECDLYRDGSDTLIDFHERGLLWKAAEQDWMEGYVVDPDGLHRDVRVLFLNVALTELLKRHGLYSIHATALEKGGRGVLIPGASGQGKTTCCVSLLRGGYRCLSDDHPFLRRGGQGLELLSFPVKVDVTEKTVGFFPELRGASERLYQGIRKQYFYLEELFPQGIAESCRPAVLLFPQIIDWPTSSLEPLPRARALQELLRHGVLALDEEVARRQFHSVADLVETVACYRLYFGEDILDLPRLLDPLLERAGAA
jgi:hypothetical protein